MLDWMKEYFLGLFEKYFVYIWDFIKSVIEKISGYFLDLFAWFFEFIFWLIDSILTFVYELVGQLLLAGLEVVSPYIPNDLLLAITSSYEWLQYINEWVPVQYGISLFVTYYSIAVALYCVRCLLSLLPVGRI